MPDTLQVFAKNQQQGATTILSNVTADIAAEIGGNALSCKVTGANWIVYSEVNHKGAQSTLHPGGQYNTPADMGMPPTGAASAQLA